MNLIEWPYYRTDFLVSQGFSKTFVRRFWEKVKIADGCWLWVAHLSGGYGRLARGPYSMILAHVASWIIHYGPVPQGHCVLHRCDVPACVNPAHLWIGNRDDNNKDRAAKGRSAHIFGSHVNGSKLTDGDVVEIRRLYARGGISQLALARKFGVSERNIFFIIHRQHWVHV